jgi:NADH-quinone oxidoreductase subunit N
MQVIEKHGDDALERFNGLGRSNPLLASGMTVGLLSMAGIPPLAGFFGKYLMFQQVLAGPYAWLAIVGVLAALAGAYYYFRIIIAMYSKPVPQSGGVAEPAGTRFVLIVTMVGTVLLGVLPTLLTSLELK